jgi:hypothetical protein
VSGALGTQGVWARDVCPVSCGTCSSEALGTAERTCGLCPVGYGYAAQQNSYSDLDECAVENGGCDAIMGLPKRSGWQTLPCTNTQGSHYCNECPPGFNTEGSACVLPPVQNATGAGNVRPVASLRVTAAASVLDEGAAQESFKNCLISDLSAALGLPQSDIEIHFATPRRRVHDVIEFEAVILSDDPSVIKQSMAEVQKQLADPASPLRGGAVMARVVADYFKSEFVCMAGQLREEGQALCADCDAGRHKPGIDGGCEPCVFGHYAPAGSSVCMECSAGKSDSDLDAATPCTQCQKGTFAAAAAMSGECIKCSAIEPGLDSDPGSSACGRCAVGNYANIKTGDCLPCRGIDINPKNDQVARRRRRRRPPAPSMFHSPSQQALSS